MMTTRTDGGAGAGARCWGLYGRKVTAELGLEPCRAMGVRPDGVVAASGYLDEPTIDRLGTDVLVARIDDLRDTVTGILAEVGGFGVEAPDLTIDDAYWELYLRD